MLREAGSFYMEIVIDSDSQRHTLFQSEKHSCKEIKNREMTNKKYTKIINSTQNTLGYCGIDYENCAYTNENIIKNIRYTVPEYLLRSFVLSVNMNDNIQ